MLNKRIAQLINYAVKNGLITAEDRIWATNRLLEAMVEDEYSEPTEVEDCELEEIRKRTSRRRKRCLQRSF